MKQLRSTLLLVLSFLFAFGGVLNFAKPVSAATNYVTVAKSINPGEISTDGEAEVSLQIKGTPPADVVVPNDVVLIIDKSGSMVSGEDKMTNAKNAAKGFIDLMDLSVHQVGVVDYSTTASTYPIGTDKAAVKSYIDGIQANGNTATGDAIDAAMGLLANHRPEAQPVIVLLTDGEATVPSNDPFGYAKNKAQVAKDAGIIFYTIALLKQTDNPDSSGPNLLMKEMATTSNHHHFVLGSIGLNEIYAAIVREIGIASAYDVKVTDIVAPEFEIVPDSYLNNIPKPQVTGNTLVWEFNELKNDTLTFTYKIRPISKTNVGTFNVGTTGSIIAYKDYSGSAKIKNIPNTTLTVKLPAPKVTSIVEPQGHPDGGNVVTINGENFVDGATVQFGTALGTATQYVSGNELKVTVPAGAQGSVVVTVKNPDGQKATGAYQYITNPVVTSIEPANGPLAGGNYVTIKGNFMMYGVSVKFGTKTAQMSLYSDPTYIRVLAPSGDQPGAVDVTVTNPDGSFTVVPAAYTYDAPPSTDPVIESISPITGLITGGNNVYINGKYLTADMKVFFGDKEAAVTYISDTRLRATAPAVAAPTIVDVTVQAVSGITSTLTDVYTYTAPVDPVPTITAVSPNTGYTTGGKNVYIDGTNFNSTSQVYFGSLPSESVTYISDTRLRARTPAVGAPSKVDVKVVNGTQEAVLPLGFEYIELVPDPVTITSLSVTSGTLNGGNKLYITGVNLKSGATIKFGNRTAILTNLISDTYAQVQVPAGELVGKVDVTWTNSDGPFSTLTQAYEYLPVPVTITGLSPNHGTKDGGTTVYIDGTNFDVNSTVTINGASVAVTYVSDTRLRIKTPVSSVVGSVPVVVTLPNGQTASTTFTYDPSVVAPAPVITSLSKTSGPAATTVYIDGSNFVTGSKVYFNGVLATGFAYVDATRVRVKSPAGTIGSVVQVTVVNPDGQVSNAVSYTYTA